MKYIVCGELNTAAVQADVATGRLAPEDALDVVRFLYGPGAIPRETQQENARADAILSLEEAARACDAGRHALGTLGDTINDMHKELTR